VTQPRFDALLFDAGGVVVMPDPVAIGDALGRPTHVPEGHRAHYHALYALEAHALASGLTHTVEHLDWNLYRAAYAAELGCTDADEAITRMSKVWTALIWRCRIEESVAALWKLYQRGVPIGIVSNASGQIEGVLRVQGVCQVGPGAGVPVTIVVDSHVVGVAKPDPAIFEPALAALGSPDRSRVAYIGDSFINDVVGAQAAGLVPIQIDPYGLYASQDHERIASLHELLDHVIG
jgi:putative hydrolase of the HAD superfamily